MEKDLFSKCKIYDNTNSSSLNRHGHHEGYFFNFLEHFYINFGSYPVMELEDIDSFDPNGKYYVASDLFNRGKQKEKFSYFIDLNDLKLSIGDTLYRPYTLDEFLLDHPLGTPMTISDESNFFIEDNRLKSDEFISRTITGIVTGYCVDCVADIHHRVHNQYQIHIGPNHFDLSELFRNSFIKNGDNWEVIGKKITS